MTKIIAMKSRMYLNISGQKSSSSLRVELGVVKVVAKWDGLAAVWRCEYRA